jgi:MFS family permease
MLALGLHDTQVGLVATIYMLSQVVFAFLSGPVTDKMGRRRATAVFDFISWCIPCLIWWRAEGLWFFVVAALLNGAMQIPTNSWDCLLIEDAEKKQITRINSLAVIAAQFSVFFAPISAILFSRLTLVPAIRILYLNAFVIMLIKLLLLYIFSRETGMGMIRREESRGKSLWSLAAGYGGVLKIIGQSRGTIFAMAITTLVGIVGMINTTFWPVIVNKKLLVPEPLLPFFPILRSVVVIVFLLFLAPRLTKERLKLPLLTGFACYFTGQLLLILAPDHGPAKYIILCISLIFDSFAAGYLFMLAKSLVALHVNPVERARVQAIMNLIIMAATAPFGWIGGLLSDVSRVFPFILNLVLLAAGFCITIAYYTLNPRLIDVQEGLVGSE